MPKVDINNGLQFFDKQKAFIFGNDKELGFVGAYGTGKTYSLWRRALRLSLKYPGNRGLIGRYSYPECRDTLWVTMKKVIPKELIANQEILTAKDPTDKTIYIRTQGELSEILIRNLDNPQKYEGLEIGWFGISQANEKGITRSLYDTLCSRLRWEKAATYHAFFEANYGAKWIISLRNEWAKTGRGNIIEASTMDNPYLPAEYIENLKSKPAWWQEYFVYGCWRPLIEGEGDPFWEHDFDYDLHISRETIKPIPKTTVIIGIDFGNTPAALWCQVNAFGQLCVIREYQQEFPGVNHLAKEIKRVNAEIFAGCKDFVLIGDPAGSAKSQTDAKSCFDVLRAEGLTVNAGIQNKVRRFETIRKILNLRIDDKYPAIIISPDCEILKGGFVQGYIIKRSIDGSIPDMKDPEKNEYSHLQDCLQYIGTKIYNYGDDKQDDEILHNQRPRDISRTGLTAGY